jgi:hypothetical protein
MMLQVTLMEIQNDDTIKAWAYAETVIGTFTMLLHMDKLRTDNTKVHVTPRSLRISRVLVDAVLKFNEITQRSTVHGALYMYSIAFYPFRGFFSLYYHILTSDDPEEYKDDILRLERICAVMQKAATVRFEYIPIAKAVVGLNNVAKQIQIAQTSQSPARQWNTLGNRPSLTPQSTADQYSMMVDGNAVGALQDPSGVYGSISNNGMDFGLNQANNMDWVPVLGDFNFGMNGDFQQMAAMPDFQPVEYLQAVEDHFQGNNWYSNTNVWDERSVPMG